MNMIPVASSNIAAVGYDYDGSILRINFNSGWTYDYYNVPASVYESLMNAPSKGSYHAYNIKNVYPYAKV